MNAPDEDGEVKTKLGVFSLSASSPDGTDDRYLAWHHLDHLPQQYEVTGVLFGQRWVSTPDCRAARVAASDRFDPVNHVVHYLFGEPVAQSVDEFFTLRDHLIEIGRFPERLPNRLVYGGEPVEVHAAPSASVTAEMPVLAARTSGSPCSMARTCAWRKCW